MADPNIGRLEYRRRKLYHEHVLTRLHSLDWGLIGTNLDRVAAAVRGEHSVAAIDQWRRLVATRDLAGISRVLTEDSEAADLMRVVSPFAGVITETERLTVIEQTPRRA
jgi:hypothetical protein